MNLGRHNVHSRLLFLTALLPLLISCEKNITVDLPDLPDQLVVEGVIEPGVPPYVILSHTVSYTAPSDANSLASRFVTGATVTVTTDGNVWALDEECSSQMDPAAISATAELTGLSPDLLSSANICIYSTHDPAQVGVVGKTYRLDVSVDGKSLSAISKIPNPVPLDSTWFELDSLSLNTYPYVYGDVWARLSDPDTIGNGYRWMSKQISYWNPDTGPYVAQEGSSFNDKLINGLTVDYKDPDNAVHIVGDTIVLKLLSLGKREYEFYSSYDANLNALSDISVPPSNVKTNITGGLGIWAGRGVYLDTIACVP